MILEKDTLTFNFCSQDHIATISRTMKPLVTKNSIKEKLRTAQGFLKKIRDLTEDVSY